MKIFAAAGAVFGFAAVALGAFGAHALKARLSADMLAVFETGVKYQMYHALALLLLYAVRDGAGRGGAAAGWLFLTGILLFSGSLYILALSGVRAWGAVTPLGGFCFLAGWIALFIALIRR